MIKQIFPLLVAVLITANAFAQAPEKMSYQAVVRDANSALVTSQVIGMQLSILQGSANGTAVYVETQLPATNTNGLVTFEIGAGTVVSGVFNSIDWSNGPYFIQTETDPNGGTNYTISGTSQLLSVPYALHANTADSIVGGFSITETDPVFGAAIAAGITAVDTANWNNHIIDTDTQLDSAGVAALGFVAGPHTVDTQIDSAGIAALGFVTTSGTSLDSAGVAALGFVAGPHTIDTQIDSTGIAGLGYVAGPHTIDTDTQLDSTGVTALGFVAGPHTIDTQIDSTGIAGLGYVAGPHTIDTDTQLDSTGVTALGFVAGPHTIDTQIDSTGIAGLGYAAGPHTIDTDTQLDSAGVAALGYVAGPHTVEVDGSITNEIQDLQLSGNNLTITNNGTATTIDLSAYLDNTDTQLTEAQVDAFANNNGYLSSEVDGSVTNEIQDLQLSGNSLTITNNGTATTIDLSAYLDNTDTQLTEAQVDAFANNNGYLSSEVDGSVTNEIQDLQLSGNNLTITNNGTATTIDLSPYLDNTDTQLTEAQVDAFANNNGYLSSEVDGSITNEIQDLQLSGNNLTITNNGTATTIDLSPYLDNTDTQLTEAQVDAFANNNGYLSTEVDGSITNEIQDLQLSGNNLTITNNGTATTIDLSSYLDNTDTQLDSAGVAALGFVAGPHSTALAYLGMARAKNQGSPNPNVDNEIPNGSSTKVRWQNVSENYGNSIGGTNNTEITIPAGVDYIRINAVITYDQILTTADSKSQFIVYKNGTPFTGLSNSGYMTYQYFNSFYSFNYTSTLIPVSAGDVFDTRLFQNSGGSLYLSWGSISSALVFEFYSN